MAEYESITPDSFEAVIVQLFIEHIKPRETKETNFNFEVNYGADRLSGTWQETSKELTIVYAADTTENSGSRYEFQQLQFRQVQNRQDVTAYQLQSYRSEFQKTKAMKNTAGYMLAAAQRKSADVCIHLKN